MKTQTRILSAVMAGAMMMSLAGCSGSSDSMTVEEGKLTMATNAFFPPYEYYDGDTIVGIDAEIAQAIADKLGMELEIVDIEFDSIIAGIQAGKYDMGMAGMTVTEDRLKSVNFSTTYATAVQQIIVTEDSEITSVDDLIGGDYIVGVQSGTTGDIYMTDDVGEDRVDRYQKGNDAVVALTSGKVDAVCIDSEPAKAFIAANEGLKILDTPYVEEEYAIAIAQDNTELLDAINGALDELIADGTVDSIVSKYITAD